MRRFRAAWTIRAEVLGCLAWLALLAVGPAMAAAARAAAEQGGPGGQPSFWAGAGALQRSLADLDGALAAGDARIFSFLDAAQRSLVALQVACRRAAAREAAGGAGPDAAQRSP